MPISATGSSAGRIVRVPYHLPGARYRAGTAGFTLVELMVVLLIVGLASGLVVMTMPDPRGSLAADAERFAARVRAAQDKAIFEARDVALEVDATGYGFEQRSRAGWRPLADRPFERRGWPEGAQVSASGSSAARAVFDVTGLSDPMELVLARGNQRVGVNIGADGTVPVQR